MSIYFFVYLSWNHRTQFLWFKFYGKNTKKNIELRETQELLVTARDSTQGLEKIDINKDYNPDNKENEENSVEMK